MIRKLKTIWWGLQANAWMVNEIAELHRRVDALEAKAVKKPVRRVK